MFKLRTFPLSAGLGLLVACTPPPGSRDIDQVAQSKSAQALEVPTQTVTEHHVPRGSSFYNSLRSLDINSQTILKIVESSKEIFSLKEIGAGTVYAITWDSSDQNEPVALEVKFAADSSLLIEYQPADLKWTATRINFPVTVRNKTFHGVVDSSLWESADLVGMDPSLITSLSEVFAWQVDFSREVKRGDRWRLTVEQKLVNDEVIGWGHILVAEYENGEQSYTGIRYPQTDESASYYAPNGQSLKQMFLKSPLKFGRVTSGFSKARFHPILKQRRPHNGVDYGAPPGTPVMTVGRGVVAEIGAHGGSGNMVKIQHNGTYATAYLHLKGFASGLRRGSTVEQGQVIGYVGTTGLSTGPHLHFSFYESGVYVDPLGRKFPSADPIARQNLGDFQNVVSLGLRTLPDWHLAQNSESNEDGIRTIIKE